MRQLVLALYTESRTDDRLYRLSFKRQQGVYLHKMNKKRLSVIFHTGGEPQTVGISLEKDTVSMTM